MAVTNNVSTSDNIQNILNPKSDIKSSSDKSATQLASNLDDFLLLLTTQLKNQDPLNPMESTDFTQQIASLSQVEQQINTNKNLENLVGLYNSTQINGVVGYIGKRIEAEGDKFTLEDNGAQISYALEKEADSVAIQITDKTGKTVFSASGDTQAGRNVLFWDGKDQNGVQLDPGLYTIKVRAADGGGNEMKSTTYTTGRVTAVDLNNGSPILMLGTEKIPLKDVLNISEDVLTI